MKFKNMLSSVLYEKPAQYSFRKGLPATVVHCCVVTTGMERNVLQFFDNGPLTYITTLGTPLAKILAEVKVI